MCCPYVQQCAKLVTHTNIQKCELGQFSENFNKVDDKIGRLNMWWDLDCWSEEGHRSDSQ